MIFYTPLQVETTSRINQHEKYCNPTYVADDFDVPNWSNLQLFWMDHFVIVSYQDRPRVDWAYYIL